MMNKLITQHIKTVDAEQRSITLASWEDIKCWMTEPNIANYFRGFQNAVDISRKHHSR